MTYEQFEEVIKGAIAAHVSADKSLIPADQEWEADNAARTIALQLRLWGLAVPAPGPNPNEAILAHRNKETSND